MGVEEAIRDADALLPGEPVEDGEDFRWQAILEAGEYIESEPEAIWSFVLRWGGHPQEDLRDAIACCLLEHHFGAYFPLVEERAFRSVVRRHVPAVLAAWTIRGGGQRGAVRGAEAAPA
jgi:hypothetical protein